jgi:hypothetical protein
MSTMLVRTYDAAASATAAAKELTDAGFEHVMQFKAAASKSAASRFKLIDEMTRAHIWQSHAEIYADRLGKGGALVVVHAPFGSSVTAAEILDAHNPLDEGIPTERAKHHDYTWNDATPFSSALQLPLLTKIKLPAEEFTGLRSLTKRPSLMSEFIGMVLLTEGPARKTESMGLPLLSRSATPLSSMFGLKTLTQNPTPLSSLFGLKVLRGRT